MSQLISVIIPTFNRADLIKRAIESVINQTYGNIEVIIVDDGSTDNTEQIVKSVKDDRVKYIKQENSGACVARNTGIEHANGSIISFLDSDDEWELSKLEKQYDFMKENSSKAVACNYWFEKNGEKRVYISNHSEKVFSIDELLDYNYVTTGSLLIEKKLLLGSGSFDPKMPRYQDWDLVIRVSRLTPIHFIDEPLLTLHSQDISISNSTSMEKKLLAVRKLYQKNTDLLKNNPKAHSHLAWSIGMYSLFSNKTDFKMLKTGVYGNGVNLRRLIIFLAIKVGLKRVIMKQYQKGH